MPSERLMGLTMYTVVHWMQGIYCYWHSTQTLFGRLMRLMSRQKNDDLKRHYRDKGNIIHMMDANTENV